MNDIERLSAIEKIKTVFARRVRCVDMKQFEPYGGLHTEDAWSDAYGAEKAYFSGHSPSAAEESKRVVGREALTEAIRKSVCGGIPVTTVHHVHQPEIEFTSETTATGIWPMEDHKWWRNGDRDEHFHGYGHYYETYRKVGDEWLISSRKLRYLRVDKTPNYDDRLR